MRPLTLLVAAYLLLPVRSSANDFCISSVAELQEAMAAVNGGQPGESYRLKIVTGDYLIVDYLGLGSRGGLALEGGYEPGCVDRSLGSSSTVIRNGSTINSDMSLHAFGGDLNVSDLTFLDFSPVFIFPQGVDHALSVSRTAIVLATDHGYVEMHTEAGSPMRLENMLVDGTNADCMMLASESEMDFLTVVNRGLGKAICMFSGDLTLNNSIVYSVSGTDIVLQPSFLLRAVSSVFDEVDGDLDPLSNGNLAGPVSFEVTNDPIYRNRPADIPQQVARDSGIDMPLVEMDILGNPRVVGSAPDRGAFELQAQCDVIFHAAFDSNDPCRSAGHSNHARPACISCR